MQVTLVKYTGKQNIANKKLLDNWHEITSQDVTTYGSFNPNAASFRLDILYDANYAVYVFNNHDYYGYVDIEVDSNGLYAYKISIDPLTTCWYAGCFTDYENICNYSRYGEAVVMDPRAIQELNSTWLVNTYYDQNTLYTGGYWAAFAICNGKGTPGGYSQTPGYDTYITDIENLPSLFDRFYKIKETVGGEEIPVANRYLPSITNICIFPKYEMNTAGLELAPMTISLYAPTTSEATDNVRTVEKHEVGIGGLPYAVYKGDTTDSSKQWYNRGKYNITLEKPINITQELANAAVIVNVPGCGTFNVPISELMGNTTFGESVIHNVGYEKRYDWISGTCKVFFTVDGGPLNDYSFICKIPAQIPIMYDNNITNWTAIRTGSAVSVVSSILGLAASAAATAATGGALAASTATAALNVAQSAFSAMNAFQSQYINDATYAGVVQGCIGSTPEWYEMPSVMIKHRVIKNLNDIQSLYGKPDGKKRVLANCTGYIQTADCQLSQEYLPKDVVTQAQAMCNAGFNIAY